MAKRVLRTPLCDMLNIDYPILSAGMGPTLIGEPNGAPVELVVAVSEAGGLGVLGGAGFTLDGLQEAIREIKAQTGKPFGVDLLLPKNLPGGTMTGGKENLTLAQVIEFLPKEHLDWFRKVEKEMGFPALEDLMVNNDTTTMNPKEAVAICIEERVPLFAAGLGDPGWMVDEAHAKGMKVLGVVGNAKNAGRVSKSGVDLIAAQGHEGGGHTGRVGTFALLPQALDAAYPVPVLAAGGVGDGRGLAAALAMGCIGVWVGTRFLATNEGGAMDLCKQRIVESTDEGTRVSKLYTGKTSRANVTRFHELWDSSGLEALPFPFQVLLASALLGGLIRSGHDDHVGGFAGQVSGLIHEIKPAAKVVEDMVEQAADILSSKLPSTVKTA
ncbi:NAD(P)H-dependent flavin oxidoreductase [Desulfatibacillum aliphaticivorans]|uniref:2-nitropropane dioxygenase NPD n=1 Tax=Desulfatibacillum aliphaticivorans TaxID=218208 RepID=B8FKK0_DESAL|nr:nitronate monooxygenase [Desulfatibacillum aliphaticivorans]ACL01815.1 2-nitropropane dioxygenase NPD [Desulfatibacillum aliphaticivorans]